MFFPRNKALRKFIGFCATVNFLQLKLLLKQPARATSFAGHIFRKYLMLAKFDGWSAITMDELVPASAQIQVQLHHLEGGGLNSSLLEIACLGLLARYSQAKKIFEIGTFRGRTALNFAANSSPECMVYTLDLPESERENILHEAYPDDARIIQQCRVGIEFRGSPLEGKIRQLYGNSMTFDYSPYVGEMDIVFIDGCHHYAAVRSDTENALKMLRPGGMIIWHDFGNFGDYYDVTRAVRELFPPNEILQIEDTQLAVYWPGRKKISGKVNALHEELLPAS
jgi:predicted O-methyltransferase YrrM